MKKILFNVVTWKTYALIWVTDRVFGVPAVALMWLQAKARQTIATLGYKLMTKIDPVRCKVAEAENESSPDALRLQKMELQLLQSSYKVRDHAKSTGDWTDKHTEAIEAIGNALLVDMGWDEDSVHEHMKSVVESIDGLELEGWFEDEE